MPPVKSIKARLVCAISPEARERLEYALAERKQTDVYVSIGKLVDEALKKSYPRPRKTNTDGER